MKNLLIISLVLGCLFTHPAVQAKATEQVQQEVQKDVQAAIETFLYGASVNDSAAHRAFWSEQLTYTSSSGTRFGWPELAQGFSDAPPLEKSEVTAWYTGENFEFKRFGDAILVNFTLVLTPVDSNEPSQRFYNTGVLQKQNGQWRAVNWNATKAVTE
ncbi:nuclear transport factor 2 family protein [Pseudidiomarina donghaiensis]|uniref:Nuclear transport factor 2 family protein n=1 Tax=Pseudidiomarina donghaiensis TaxID=519452 RepID=A0A432XDI8_9GAMM|nr:nuclear transport factor 2 family protein [Pseudidiomarina donghaiensis]RUO46765.1 nuclear transport factor 2 family protein [Pseudidiomarina donghaiensis]SFV24569.1 protein of unknown function [Pseudidiomarina donghaiensis]